jgi:putative hemolysin
VIEEIVGEIRDEYDAAEVEPFAHVSDTEAIVNGSISISEFNGEFEVELPTDESDTLGGLIYTQLGRLPRIGDKVRVRNVELMVTSLNGRRIKQVRALKLAAEPQGAAKTDENEKRSE